MIELTEKEKSLIRIIQADIPVAEQPYKAISEQIGISEAEVIAKIKEFREKGYIRRFGATLRHREAGISANGMGIWIVPKDDAERVGNIMASFKEVTHCYERPTFSDEKWGQSFNVHSLYSILYINLHICPSPAFFSTASSPDLWRGNWVWSWIISLSPLINLYLQITIIRNPFILSSA